MNNIARKISLRCLSDLNLTIPVYQRPYKWTTGHTEDLLNDIQKAMDERPNVPYVMGTIIAHQKDNSEEYEIVDGQQRLTTLSILLAVLKSTSNSTLLRQEYRHVASKKNIVQNAHHIENWLFKKNMKAADFPEWVEYLFDQLWFVLILPPTMDEAFAFFDSQNSRGKRLEDYDLLKASHLRCITGDVNGIKAKNCSHDWEELDKKDKLTYLLQNLWGRTRTLSRKDGTQVIIKKEFKAVFSAHAGSYCLNNYIQPPLFKAWAIDSNRQAVTYTLRDSWNSFSGQDVTIYYNDLNSLPFQITKTVESGEPFFLFTQKYYRLYRSLFENEEYAQRVFKRMHDGLSGFNNTGIGFLTEAYIATLIFYVDKFGDVLLDEVALWLEHVLLFKRLSMYSLRYSTVNNHLMEINPFEIIEQSSIPSHVVESLIVRSETLYTMREVKLFDVIKGIRKAYYDRMYGADGFFRCDDVQSYKRLSKAKAILFDLNLTP